MGVVDYGWQDGKRVRKSVYGATRAEVQKTQAVAQADKQKGLPPSNDRLTVEQYLKLFLDEYGKSQLRARTFESYSQIINQHIVPALGKKRLAQLTPRDVQAYLDSKRVQPGLSKQAADGLSARSVQYHRTILRKALNQAIKWEYLARNVAALAEPPRAERHEIVPLTVEQAQAFLNAVRGHRLEALFTVGLALGMREGEVLGLRWEDVDLEHARVIVRKQVQRIFGKLQLVDLKTDLSRRTISLPAFAVDALRAHHIRQLKQRLAATGGEWDQWGLVFPSTRGTPMDARNLVRQFHAVLDQAGLPHKRFHDLRHTFATLLLLQGEDLNVVKQVLGHIQISLTADTYQHVVEALKRGAADKLQALFGAAVAQR